ncbi:MAG: hypothetical protein KIT79_05915 [Deltaproteobacteria bacterium]|nr:hypothetical protein [Deltaproteobacteria bacterium]
MLQRLPFLKSPAWIIAGFVTLVFIPALFAGQTLWHWDVTLNFFPNQIHHIRRLQQGDFPLWTSGIFGGFPFAADPVQSVFHPLKLLFFLPANPAWLVNAFVALLFVLFGTGMFALGRSLKFSPPAAVFAGLVAAGSGALASHTSLQNYLLAIASVPWALAAFIRSSEAAVPAGKARWLALSAVLHSLSLLAGEPQTFVLSTVLMILLAVFSAGTADDLPAARLRTALASGAVAFAAFTLAAIQWMPTLHLLKEVVRNDGISWERAHQCSSHPARFVEMLFPLFFGSATNLGTLWPQSLFCDPVANRSFYIWSYFLGFIPLFFAALSLKGIRRRRSAWPFLLLTLLGIMFALGPLIGLFGLFWKYVPLWNQFRLPERFIPWAIVGISMLAGYGFDDALGHDRRSRTGLVLMLSAIALVALSWFTPLWEQFGSLFRPVDADVMGSVISGSLAEGRLYLLVAAAAGALMWKLRRTGYYLPWLVTTAAALPLSINSLDVMRFIPGEETVYSEPAAVAALRAGENRTDPLRIWPLPVFHGFRFPPGSPDYWRHTIHWHLLDMDTVLVTDFSSIRGYNAFIPERHARATRDLPNANHIRLFAVDAIIAAPGSQPDTDDMGNGPLFLGSFRAITVSDPVPRVICPRNWRSADTAGIDRMVRSPDFDPRETLFVEADDFPSGSRPAAKIRQCEIRSYDHDRVHIMVDQEAGGPVVLMDAWFRGWTASVNGTPADIFPAWGVHRAVMLPTGRSVVEFRYWPPGLTPGLWTSGLMLLMLLGYAVWRPGRL